MNQYSVNHTARSLITRNRVNFCRILVIAEWLSLENHPIQIEKNCKGALKCIRLNPYCHGLKTLQNALVGAASP